MTERSADSTPPSRLGSTRGFWVGVLLGVPCGLLYAALIRLLLTGHLDARLKLLLAAGGTIAWLALVYTSLRRRPVLPFRAGLSVGIAGLLFLSIVGIVTYGILQLMISPCGFRL